MNADPSDPKGAPSHGELRAFLLERGIHPTRRHGQNFLLDENLLAAIVRDARIAVGDHVLEIGCGPGLLTRHLARTGAQVLAVDIDARLIPIARELVGPASNVAFLHADALAGKHELAPELVARLAEFPRFKLVANLPYAVATPLLVELACSERPPAEMLVLVQREAADRYVAAAGSKVYGAVSVRLQARYGIERVRAVPPTVFWPRPQVDSTVARLTRRDDPPPASALAAVDALVDVGFGQRRKRLARNLVRLDATAPWERWVAGAAGTAAARAEDLPLEAWLSLAREWEGWRTGGP